MGTKRRTLDDASFLINTVPEKMKMGGSHSAQCTCPVCGQRSGEHYPHCALREGRWQPSGELSLPRLRKGWWKAFRPLLLSGVRRGRLTDFEFRKTRTQLVLRPSSPRNRRQARRKSIFSVTR